MATRNTSSSSTILIILVLILTFPVWIAVGAVVIGVVGGLFGAAVGIIGALFGVVAALIALPFKLLFGWGDWGWHGFPHFHWNTCALLAFIIIVALAIRAKNRN